MRKAALVILILVATANCYSYDRTEAQRYYDLGMSYIKSDLYEDGLKTLNQVAFLFPDSDVADDALYRLALIRELVGDGKINIGTVESLEAVRAELDRLTGGTSKWEIASDILTMINAQQKGKRVFDIAKERAIAQYILALDYLNTSFQRYPDSDILSESKRAFERILRKIDATIKQPKTPTKEETSRQKYLFFAGISVIAIIILFKPF